MMGSVAEVGSLASGLAAGGEDAVDMMTALNAIFEGIVQQRTLVGRQML
jgi:hypothetical protein